MQSAAWKSSVSPSVDAADQIQSPFLQKVADVPCKILELPEMGSPVARGFWRQVSYTTYSKEAAQDTSEESAQLDASNVLVEVAEMNLLLKK